MNKTKLIKHVAQELKISTSEAKKATDAFFDHIITSMEAGRRIELRGFGIFESREYDGYMGRNPKTGEMINIPPKRMPFFKMGKYVLENKTAPEENDTNSITMASDMALKGTGTDV